MHEADLLWMNIKRIKAHHIAVALSKIDITHIRGKYKIAMCIYLVKHLYLPRFNYSQRSKLILWSFVVDE